MKPVGIVLLEEPGEVLPERVLERPQRFLESRFIRSGELYFPLR